MSLYDDAGRRTSVTYPGPSTTSYAFDAFGNRTGMTDSSGTTAYAYDDASRLTSVTPPSPAPAVSYTWDNNGDLTARGSDSFAWDYEDRMTSATVGGTTTSFTYRGDGLRNSRITGMTTTTFTWDVNAGLPVVLDDGSQYVCGAGLEAMVTGSGTYYYLADGLGSTMALVDTGGTVLKSYTYDVYGRPTATGALANEFDFAGQETDPTGLQYLRARYMDPETGTFLSRDPVSSSPGWTSPGFAYADGSPASLVDPLGLYPGGGNATENAWCWDKWANLWFGERLQQCHFVGNTLREYAWRATEYLYGGNPDDGPANAFRHCCWLGLITLHFGSGTARGYGERHETLLPGEPGFDDPLREVRSKIDLYNNEVGISITKNISKRSWPTWVTQDKVKALLRACQAAADSGRTINDLNDPRAQP